MTSEEEEDKKKGLHSVVVTGFGPFDCYKINSSWETAKELDNLGLDSMGIELILQQIPVSYDCVLREIPLIWEECNPILVVHMGVSGTAKEVQLETVAHRKGYCKGDIDGLCPRENCCNGTEEFIKTELDLETVCDKIKKMPGIRIRPSVSSNAGRYVCEFTYYMSLNINNARVVFVHVPDIDKPYSVKEMAECVKEIILLLVEEILTKTRTVPERKVPEIADNAVEETNDEDTQSLKELKDLRNQLVAERLKYEDNLRKMLDIKGSGKGVLVTEVKALEAMIAECRESRRSQNRDAGENEKRAAAGSDSIATSLMISSIQTLPRYRDQWNEEVASNEAHAGSIRDSVAAGTFGTPRVSTTDQRIHRIQMPDRKSTIEEEQSSGSTVDNGMENQSRAAVGSSRGSKAADDVRSLWGSVAVDNRSARDSTPLDDGKSVRGSTAVDNRSVRDSTPLDDGKSVRGSTVVDGERNAWRSSSDGGGMSVRGSTAVDAEGNTWRSSSDGGGRSVRGSTAVDDGRSVRGSTAVDAEGNTWRSSSDGGGRSVRGSTAVDDGRSVRGSTAVDAEGNTWRSSSDGGGRSVGGSTAVDHARNFRESSAVDGGGSARGSTAVDHARNFRESSAVDGGGSARGSTAVDHARNFRESSAVDGGGSARGSTAVDHARNFRESNAVGGGGSARGSTAIDQERNFRESNAVDGGGSVRGSTAVDGGSNDWDASNDQDGGHFRELSGVDDGKKFRAATPVDDGRNVWDLTAVSGGNNARDPTSGVNVGGSTDEGMEESSPTAGNDGTNVGGVTFVDAGRTSVDDGGNSTWANDGSGAREASATGRESLGGAATLEARADDQNIEQYGLEYLNRVDDGAGGGVESTAVDEGKSTWESPPKTLVFDLPAMSQNDPEVQDPDNAQNG